MTFLVNRVANAFVWTSVATAPKIAETDPMSMDAVSLFPFCSLLDLFFYVVLDAETNKKNETRL